MGTQMTGMEWDVFLREIREWVAWLADGGIPLQKKRICPFFPERIGPIIYFICANANYWEVNNKKRCLRIIWVVKLSQINERNGR
jgi:hypothetical protein